MKKEAEIRLYRNFVPDEIDTMTKLYNTNVLHRKSFEQAVLKIRFKVGERKCRVQLGGNEMENLECKIVAVR